LDFNKHLYLKIQHFTIIIFKFIDSGGDSDCGGTSAKSSSHKDRFFWQYNVQSKGPKGQRLVLKCKLEDPHCLNEVTDPVFSPNCSIQGIKHR